MEENYITNFFLASCNRFLNKFKINIILRAFAEALLLHQIDIIEWLMVE